LSIRRVTPWVVDRFGASVAAAEMAAFVDATSTGSACAGDGDGMRRVAGAVASSLVTMLPTSPPVANHAADGRVAQQSAVIRRDKPGGTWPLAK